MNKQKSNNNITNMDDSLYVRVSLIFFFFFSHSPLLHVSLFLFRRLFLSVKYALFFFFYMFG
jgi:hypothetical protein